jgi:putative transposase
LVTVSRASLNRWIHRYRTGGFDALTPAQRQIAARTDPAVLELAARLKREHPARTAAHIARIVEAEQGRAPSARTLQRYFARLELGTRPDGNPPAVFGRFEAQEPDELWVSDGLHGPVVEGKRAVLFAVLDDYSRYVPGHRWGHGEDTLGMQATLHDAVKTHGCPRNSTAATEAYTLRISWPGRRPPWASGWCTAGRENHKDAEKSSVGIAPCATSSWSRSRPPAGSIRWMS